jgi:hypothetical protein
VTTGCCWISAAVVASSADQLRALDGQVVRKVSRLRSGRLRSSAGCTTCQMRSGSVRSRNQCAPSANRPVRPSRRSGPTRGSRPPWPTAMIHATVEGRPGNHTADELNLAGVQAHAYPWTRGEMLLRFDPAVAAERRADGGRRPWWQTMPPASATARRRTSVAFDQLGHLGACSQPAVDPSMSVKGRCRSNGTVVSGAHPRP